MDRVEHAPDARLDALAREWQVQVERIDETRGSLLAFGTRRGRPVVLKIVKAGRDEWRSGQVLSAFGGRGVVRVYEQQPGAALIERASPGGSLAGLTAAGADAQATAALAATIREMAPGAAPAGTPSVADWGAAFEWYLASGHTQLPRPLVVGAQRLYCRLCESQRDVRLLHGDLHHDNVLLDAERGYLAIDPKGVTGEVAFEVGAALRNPREQPAVFADAVTIDRRIGCFVDVLGLDRARVTAWAFAQVMLAAAWIVQDGNHVEPDDGWRVLADRLHARVTYDGPAAS